MADLIFCVHRTELLPALAAAIEAVSRKDTIPILMNVLLKPQAGRLTVRGTDLDTEVETDCDLLATGTGEAITVAAKAVYDIARSAPESAEISFGRGKGGGQVVISASRSRYTLNTLPESDFPGMGKTRPDESFTLEAAKLAEAFGKVAYAIERADRTRYYLMGAYLVMSSPSVLDVVGCDGKSLAVVRIALEQARPFGGVIVPLKTVATFRKLLGESRASCTVSISDTQIVFECEGVVLTSKLVDGRYPDYPRIIPKREGDHLLADRSEIRAAIARALAITSDASREALKLTVGGGVMQMQLMTHEGEDATESVNVAYTGERFVKGFNGSFLTAALASVHTAEFRLYGGTDPAAAGLITPHDDSNEDYVLMPMWVS